MLESQPEKASIETQQDLSIEEIREKMNDPEFLPSYDVLTKHFESFIPIALHCHDDEYVRWNELIDVKNKGIYEIWTAEYIHAFGQYLAHRMDELGATAEKPAIILEVGAGNGRLSHFLQEELDQIAPGKAKVIASDSGKWNIQADFPVINVPLTEALSEYQPQIVLVSWMPYGSDFTADIRATNSVVEYILIGEADGGNSGDDWLTWGIRSPFDDDQNQEPIIPPYELDGYIKVNLEDLKKFQLSRTNVTEGRNLTETVSFRKTI